MNYMNNYCGRFALLWDMNSDGAVTVSDFIQWVRFLWNLPAKLITEGVAGNPKIAAFFEIDCGTGEGWGGAVFSFFVWFIVINIAMESAQSK